jgi:hypothetical protein
MFYNNVGHFITSTIRKMPENSDNSLYRNTFCLETLNYLTKSYCWLPTKSHKIASCLIGLETKWNWLYINYFHILTSRFFACSASYANKGITRFKYRQREFCPFPTDQVRQNYTTMCSADNKKLTHLSMPLHVFILNFQDRNFFLFRKGIDVSASPACPSDKSRMKTKIFIKRRLNGTGR